MQTCQMRVQGNVGTRAQVRLNVIFFGLAAYHIVLEHLKKPLCGSWAFSQRRPERPECLTAHVQTSFTNHIIIIYSSSLLLDNNVKSAGMVFAVNNQIKHNRQVT